VRVPCPPFNLFLEVLLITKRRRNLFAFLYDFMLHFPSKLASHGTNGIPGRSDSSNLNATQQRSASHPVFLKVEEELHDARRVFSDGQEDDLRYALSMVINRVSELVGFSFDVREDGI